MEEFPQLLSNFIWISGGCTYCKPEVPWRHRKSSLWSFRRSWRTRGGSVHQQALRENSRQRLRNRRKGRRKGMAQI